MTPEARRTSIGLGIGVLAGAGLVVAALVLLVGAGLWPSGAIHDAIVATSNPAGEVTRIASLQTAHAGDISHGSDAGPQSPAAADSENSLMVGLERLQSIGVRFEPAKARRVDRTIRTVGRVEVDERRIAHINVKLEGWIDGLMVNSTGERVRTGQVLFTLYSPELVSTQQEYLLALQGRARLGSSEFREVAEAAQGLLDAARQRLRFWDIEDSHISDLETTGTILKTLPIHSPASGTVINKTAVVGLQVKPGDELYTVADLSRVWVQADIFEYELPLIAVGQTATLTASYLPDVTFKAVAQFIYPTVDTNTRAGKVRFEVDNLRERLKPGMFMNLELKIPLGTRLVVPKDAVLETGERQLIFIHHGGGRLEWRSVRLGLRADDWVEILEGVSDGDHIITSANFLLDSESQLKAAVAGMRH